MMDRTSVALTLGIAVLVSLLVVAIGGKQRGRRRLLLMRGGVLAALAAAPLAVLSAAWATSTGISDTLAVIGLVMTFVFGLAGNSLSQSWRRVTVAVVITSRVPFFRELRRGLREGLEELPVDIRDEYESAERPLEDLTDFRPALRRACRRLPDYLVICCPSHIAAGSPEVMRVVGSLTRRGGAVFFVEDAPPAEVVAGLRRVYTVTSDSTAGARAIARHIGARLKDRPVYLLCGPEYSRAAQTRQATFAELIPEHQVILCDVVGWTATAAHRSAMDVLSTCPPKTVVVSGNDSMALGVVEAIRESDRPDVSVIGYDGIRQALVSIAEPSNPLIATLRTPPSAYGHEVAARIRELLGTGDRVQPREQLQREKIMIPVDDAHLVTDTNVGLILDDLW